MRPLIDKRDFPPFLPLFCPSLAAEWPTVGWVRGLRRSTRHDMMDEHRGKRDPQVPDAAWLRARLRAGDLTADGLELAAYCGDGAAAQVSGRSPEPVAQHNNLWADGLRKWGAIATIRAIVALARYFACDWRPGVGVGDLERGLRTSEQWILCPCDQHRREALDRRVTAGGWGWFNRLAETIPKRATMRARRAGSVAESAALAIEELAAPGTLPNFWPQLWRMTLPLPWSKPKEDGADLRSAITEELIPWAVGFRDPVAERLADF